MSPNPQKIAADPNITKDRIQTVYTEFPPLQAFSEIDKPAVSGTSTSTATGVYGKSAKNDGVHGESAGPAMSGVAGIHTAGGNGVYGKSSGNAGYFDGNVTVTGDIYLSGADCAEQFDYDGNHPPAPGTLLVMSDRGALIESQASYDKKVVGIVAGAGRHRPGIILDTNVTNSPRVVISLTGKAYCKVDADYGSVEVGDLLTTSPNPGYAMKAADPLRAFGAVIGKALQPLESGQDLIAVLVTLQ